MSISLNVYVGPVLVINLEPQRVSVHVEACCTKCEHDPKREIFNARDSTSTSKKFCAKCGGRLSDFDIYEKKVPEVDCDELFGGRLLEVKCETGNGYGPIIEGKAILIPNVKFDGGYHVENEKQQLHRIGITDADMKDFESKFEAEIEKLVDMRLDHEIQYAAVNWWS